MVDRLREASRRNWRAASQLARNVPRPVAGYMRRYSRCLTGLPAYATKLLTLFNHLMYSFCSLWSM
jgi:hypothetical protein